MFARIGRFCYRNRGQVVAAWLVLLIVGLVAGSQVFTRLTQSRGSNSVESVQAYRQLSDAATTGPRLVALVDGVTVDDAGVRAAVVAGADKLRSSPDVAQVVDVYDTPSPLLRSSDGKASIVAVDLRKHLSDTRQRAAVRQVHDALSGVPDARVLVGGSTVFNQEINDQVQKDLATGELVSLPIALVVLVFIFGGFVAALRPLGVAVASIGGGLLVLLGFSFVMDLDPNVPTIVTVLGLGLAIDYGLLMANRYREERLGGRDPQAAVERAVATAGRAITFSGLTVIAALTSLFMFRDPTYSAMGAGGVSVVVVALVAALTLTPALLSLGAGKASRRRSAVTEPHGVFHRFSRPAPEEGFFSAMTLRAQRFAVPIVVVLVVVLAAAAVPFLHAKFSNGSTVEAPHSFQARQVDQALQQRFPGNQVEPVQVDLPVRPTDSRVAPYVARLGQRPDVASVAVAKGFADTLTVVYVYPKGEGQGPQAQQLVKALRADRPAFGSKVTGAAAFLVDFRHEIASGLPWALLWIAVSTFVLLFLMTGSVLVPLKALVMNVLSLGASFGALVWVFQEGHLSHVLGFTSSGTIQTWVPVLVFVFAFGLSMDYEVFLLSRIKELYDEGYPNDDAVRLGLQRSGRIITSAALLIVVVFAGFASGRMIGIKEMGLALSLAVLVDATLVRTLLVPATMTLLGDLNWWAPGPLRRLHDRIGLRESPASAPVPRESALPRAAAPRG